MSKTVSKKTQLGQFFTEKNVFLLPGFSIWFETIPLSYRSLLIEPFAGAMNIVKMMNSIYTDLVWANFDIDPPVSDVIQRDTLKDFPSGYRVCITNPPYLAKVSASRKKMNVDFESFDDLYELSLARCLTNCEYVAAIIPESFISHRKLKERLHTVISLPFNDMFSDTEHPVCLAMFSPEPSTDYNVYKGHEYIGTYQQLKSIHESFLGNPEVSYTLRFNDPAGALSLVAIDSTSLNALKFGIGLVSPSEIKVSSRARTLISLDVAMPEGFIEKLNENLNQYRELTHDVFLTSFKGLRKDGFYRRRLSFGIAERLIQKTLNELI